MITKPRALVPGDRIAAVSSSFAGPAVFPARYEVGKRQLEEAFGVEVVEMPHTRASQDHLARHPEDRADDLHAAFADPRIAGVVATVGGEDSLRILRHLDVDLIAANPKVVLGYSDTTVTHLACLRAGLVSFYGPSVMAGFAENGGLHPYLVEGVRRALFEDPTRTAWPPNADGWTAEFLDWADPANQQRRRTLTPSTGPRWHGAGRATGRLVPACLEVLDWLRGSVWWPELDGAVLALETSEEGAPPSTVTRFLRVLAATGELHRLRALLFARPGGVPAARHPDYDLAILEVVRREEGLDDLPVVTNLDFGHTDPIWTLPVGTEVLVDGGARTIRLTERPTTPA